jgi:hypothetical protein
MRDETKVVTFVFCARTPAERSRARRRALACRCRRTAALVAVLHKSAGTSEGLLRAGSVDRACASCRVSRVGVGRCCATWQQYIGQLDAADARNPDDSRLSAADDDPSCGVLAVAVGRCGLALASQISKWGRPGEVGALSEPMAKRGHSLGHQNEEERKKEWKMLLPA